MSDANLSETNIVLIGFMGSGKSLTAKCLASRLGKMVVSTDDLIEAQERRPITEIFAREGEAYFRNIEKAAVAEASGRSGIIIDCGGGVVLDPENLKRLKASGRVFYLKASAEALYKNVKGRKHRPLLNVTDPLSVIQEKLAERKPFYEQADDVILSEGRTIEDMAEEIMGKLGGS